GSIAIKGLRIGVNGAEAKVGQAYAPLDVTVTDVNYTAGVGQRLSDVGTIIALEKGPDSDLFFLSFDQIGSMTHVRTEPVPPTPATPADKPESSQLGLRTFAEINASLAAITGISMNDANVKATYALVEQQLPSVPTIEGFVASQQVGVAQLAIQYCDALVESNQAASFFPGLNLNASPATAFANMGLLVNPLIANGVGINLATQPTDLDTSSELADLVTLLTPCTTDCPVRTKTITKAACAAVLGSGAVLLK
ncbi:MAG: hypothetical protein WCD08_04190, partial [Steroidobacteraceae bacterium]